MAFASPDSDAIRALLRSVKTIAVVGFSRGPGRPGHTIARCILRDCTCLS